MSATEDLLAANPFPGLRPFDTAEADRFFGRQQQITELAARLDQVSFLAVTGDSGCGKSSLVRAGLLGHLRQRFSDGGQTAWRCAVLRPGDRPMVALAHALCTALAESHAEADDEARLLGRLRVGGHGLIDAVRLAHLPPGQRLLLVVDQFEEIFRFELLDRDEASAFVKLLLNVALDPASPVCVVITTRSDALGSCAIHRGLPEAVSRGQYLVPRLTRAQRKEAIVGPVEELRGQRISPRLTQRLLNDVSETYDELPVLQHVLSRTWACWARETAGELEIDLDDYARAGTARNALSLHGKEACNDLPGLQAVIEKVFRALTDRVSDGGDGPRSGEGRERRRPLSFGRLCQAVGGSADDVAQVVERFRRADTGFLASGGALASDPIIDISHESLIRLWDQLRSWVDAEAQAGQRIRRLVDQALEHRERDGPRLEGRGLADALEWAEQQRPTPAWVGLYVGAAQGEAAWTAVRRYLDESRDAQQRKQLQEQAEQQRQRADKRRRQAIGATALAGFVAFLLISVASFHLATQSRSRELLSHALREKEGNPARAAHLALVASELDGDNANALFALRGALAALELAHMESILPIEEAITDMRYSADRSRLLLISGKSVSIHEARAFQALGQPVRRERNIVDARLTGDNSTMVTMTDDYQVQLQRLDGGAEMPLICPGQGNTIFTVEVAPTGAHIALGCYSGEVLVWHAASGTVRQTHAFSHRGKYPVTTTALAFSDDGTLLASGDADGVINVWRLDRPAEPTGRAWIGESLPGARDSKLKHDKGVAKLEFMAGSPEFLVSAGDDKTARVWRLTDVPRKGGSPPGAGAGALERSWRLPASRAVIAAKFVRGQGEARQVLTLAGKEATLWTDEKPTPPLKGHEDLVTDVDVATDAPLFVTASEDGTARIWRVVGNRAAPVAVLRGQGEAVKRALFIAADGTRLLTLGSGGRVYVWRLTTPALLAMRDHWMLGASMEPGGLVLLAEEGKATVLDTRTPAAEPVQLNGIDDNGIISYVSWSRDAQWAAGMQWGATPDVPVRVHVWNPRTGESLGGEWLTQQRIAQFCASADEVLTLNKDGQIALWPAAALLQDAPMPLATYRVADTARGIIGLSPDCRWIAASKGEAVELWSREHPERVPIVLAGHKGSIRSIAFSADSRWLLTASTDRTARAWSLATQGQEFVVLPGATAGLYSAAFDPSGKQVATGSGDGQVGLWTFDAARRSAELLVTLRRHAEGINTVEFSPDGTQILSASDDGSVRLGACKVCTLDSAQLRDMVRTMAVLSPAELAQIAEAGRISFADLGWRRKPASGR